MSESTADAPHFPAPRIHPFAPPQLVSKLRVSACPVGRASLYDGTPAWLVTRYEDVRTVLGDDRFSTVGGGASSRRLPVPPQNARKHRLPRWTHPGTPFTAGCSPDTSR